MGAWVALEVVWLAPFQLTGQEQATVDAIALEWWPFRAVYGALLVTTLVCGITRLVRDVRRASCKSSLDRDLPPVPSRSAAGTLDAAAEALSGAGWKVERGPDRVVAVRRTESLLGGSVFHLALPLLAAGLVLHSVTFGSIDFKLVEGQSADLVVPDVRAGSGRWEPLTASVPSMTLDSITARFYEDVLLFERLDARVSDERSKRSRTLSLAYPLWVDPFTMMSIQDFGYAPDIQLVDANGTVREEVIGTMKVFPPGSQDRLRLPSNGYTVSLMVYPDHAVKDGRDVSLSFNLKDPKMLVAVEQDYPQGLTRARALVGLGELVEGADLDVRIKALREFGTFRVSRSYGWPLVALSSLLMLWGLAVRLLLPREEVVIWEHDRGLGMTGRVDGRSGFAARDALLSKVGEILGPGAPGQAADGNGESG